MGVCRLACQKRILPASDLGGAARGSHLARNSAEILILYLGEGETRRETSPAGHVPLY